MPSPGELRDRCVICPTRPRHLQSWEVPAAAASMLLTSSAEAESEVWFSGRKQSFVQNLSPPLSELFAQMATQSCELTIDSPLNAPQDTIRVGLPSLGEVTGLACRSCWSGRASVQDFYTVVSLSWETMTVAGSPLRLPALATCLPVAGPPFTCGNIVCGCSRPLALKVLV